MNPTRTTGRPARVLAGLADALFASIRRIRRLPAGLAGPPGTVEWPAHKPPRPTGRRPSRSRRDGVASQFIQEMAAAASVAAGHQPGWPGHWPPPAHGRRHGQYDPATLFRFNHNIRPASDRGGN
jgi:hypothetical protein